ncbi:hypothetical protein EMIT0210MI2_11820 [Priestia megaterium]
MMGTYSNSFYNEYSKKHKNLGGEKSELSILPGTTFRRVPIWL